MTQKRGRTKASVGINESRGGRSLEGWVPTALFLGVATLSYLIIRRQWPERAVRWLWRRIVINLLGLRN